MKRKLEKKKKYHQIFSQEETFEIDFFFSVNINSAFRHENHSIQKLTLGNDFLLLYLMTTPFTCEAHNHLQLFRSIFNKLENIITKNIKNSFQYAIIIDLNGCDRIFYKKGIYLFLKAFFFCSISPHGFFVHVNGKITSCTSSNDLPSNCPPNLKKKDLSQNSVGFVF